MGITVQCMRVYCIDINPCTEYFEVIHMQSIVSKGVVQGKMIREVLYLFMFKYEVGNESIIFLCGLQGQIQTFPNERSEYRKIINLPE